MVCFGFCYFLVGVFAEWLAGLAYSLGFVAEFSVFGGLAVFLLVVTDFGGFVAD